MPRCVRVCVLMRDNAKPALCGASHPLRSRIGATGHRCLERPSGEARPGGRRGTAPPRPPLASAARGDDAATPPGGGGPTKLLLPGGGQASQRQQGRGPGRKTRSERSRAHEAKRKIKQREGGAQVLQLLALRQQGSWDCSPQNIVQ